jgi:hypothetical protein
MPIWLEAFLEMLGEKLLVPNMDKIRESLLRVPWLVAAIAAVPIFGVIISYGMVLDQAKFLILLFADILMLLLLPVYPIYKLVQVIDVYVLAVRRKEGRELGNLEFFWN